MNTPLLLLIIALALLTGYYLSQKFLHDQHRNVDRLSRDYFLGLNFLLNEEPDKAVDVFTRLLQIDPETVETHLALGNLFRRRGEIGRAIRIHQNLIARPQLPRKQRMEALLALGRDYFHAGLIDRAERLFLEIAQIKEHAVVSSRYLIEIYQQQKKWPDAIKIAQQLKSLTDEHWQVQIAHYHCELAEEYWQKAAGEAAHQELKQAFKADAHCARASLLAGKLEYLAGRYKEAIQRYQKIAEQDPDYFCEALPALVACYQALQAEPKLVSYLQEKAAVIPYIGIAIFLAEYLHKHEGHEQAMQFLMQHLRQHPSLQGLQYFIGLQLAHSSIYASQERLQILQDLVKKLLEQLPQYRCRQCGFRSKSLIWFCPGCRSWSSIRPVQNDILF